MSDLQSAYVPRGRYGVPTRAASAVIGTCPDCPRAFSACLTCSWLISFVFYKVTEFGFGFFFWLHQGGIPRCTWGFYCCLAAHQRTGTAGFANPPFPILWTLTLPPGESAAAGHDCCRGLGAILYAAFRCRSLVPNSEFGAAGCVRLGIARVSEDFARHISFVFHYWWDGLFVSAATWGFCCGFS